LAVDPGKDFAFFPPQVLTGPVDGQSPVPPFLATMRSAIWRLSRVRTASCWSHRASLRAVSPHCALPA